MVTEDIPNTQSTLFTSFILNMIGIYPPNNQLLVFGYVTTAHYNMEQKTQSCEQNQAEIGIHNNFLS